MPKVLVCVFCSEEIEAQEKKGYRTEIEVVHPLDGEWRLPVYIANFVLMDYGTGAIFGVPGHDQRDFEFARKYDLPVRIVVRSDETPATAAACWVGVETPLTELSTEVPASSLPE